MLLQATIFMLVSVVTPSQATQANPPAKPPLALPEITRVSATLNGVFSPRGFFNVLVPLDKTRGAQAAKLDLKKSRITIDFAPGTMVTKGEIRQVMVEAGYRPGEVEIETLPPSQATEIGPGWTKIKHPKSRNAVVRWAEENF